MIFENPSNYKLQAFDLVPMYITIWPSYSPAMTVILYWLCLGRRDISFKNNLQRFAGSLEGYALCGSAGPFWSGFV